MSFELETCRVKLSLQIILGHLDIAEGHAQALVAKQLG